MKQYIQRLGIVCICSLFVLHNAVSGVKNDDFDINIPVYYIDPKIDCPYGKSDNSQDMQSDTASNPGDFEDFSEEKGFQKLVKKIKKMLPKKTTLKQALKILGITGVVIGGSVLSGYTILKITRIVKNLMRSVLLTASKAAFISACLYLFTKKTNQSKNS